MSQAVETAGLCSAPLAGLTVIEIATYVAGPSGGMALAQLGADVIRVDPLGGATDTRRLPLADSGDSLYWAGLNKGKRSVEIDLASDAGRALTTALIAAATPGSGIVLTNSVGQSWLAYEALATHRADLIQVHITGRSDGAPAVDYTVNCEVGLPQLTGPSELTPPVNHVLPAWDLLTGLHAALAILVAERVRDRTGRGQLITVSLADVAASTMAHLGFVADVAVNGGGRLRDGNYLYGSFGCDFETSDGERLMIVALTPRHWRELVNLTGMTATMRGMEDSLDVDLESESDRYELRAVLSALFRPWFAARTAAEVTAAVGARNLLWGKYRSVDDLVKQPDSILNQSTLFMSVDQPGIGRLPTPGSALRMGWSTNPEPSPAPRLGEHTHEVLGEVLGLDTVALTALRNRGVIGGPR